jgi:heptosyltransferase-3
MSQGNKKNGLLRSKAPFPYSLNKTIRGLAMRAMRLITGEAKEMRNDLHKEQIQKILLVRATFRMGSSVLATPAIFLFRRSFPHARIDIVGSPISKSLFRNLPIGNHVSVTRRFPSMLWAFFALLNKIRSAGYDLAMDVSCSQSATGSFIVGFSGARFRVGAKGKGDQWFNVTIPRPPEVNKYQVLPAFLRSLSIETPKIFPLVLLSPKEKEEGRRIEALAGGNQSPIVGVFVGGRKAKGKRWPMENFIQLITSLRAQGIKVVVFFGPEEKRQMEVFRQSLGKNVPLIFEPSALAFASMVSNYSLFISCDSGPMHLACALGVRTIAIFQNSDFKRWGPPANMAQIVYEPGGVSAEEVLKISLAELCCKIIT